MPVVAESVWELQRAGKTPEQIIGRQRSLVLQGRTLYDYASWHYLFAPADIQQPTKPKPKPMSIQEEAELQASTDRSLLYLKTRGFYLEQVNLSKVYEGLNSTTRGVLDLAAAGRNVRDICSKTKLARRQMQRQLKYAVNVATMAQFGVKGFDWVPGSAIKDIDLAKFWCTPKCNVIAFLHSVRHLSYKEIEDLCEVKSAASSMFAGIKYAKEARSNVGSTRS